MTGHGEKASRQHEAAIAALLSCPTLGKAAKRAGIGEKTLWRWLQEPAFQARYRAARRQVVEAAIGKLQQATTEAVEALRRNLKAKGRPAVQVSAARTILEQAVKAVELMDLVARVDALEHGAEEKGGSHGVAA